METKVKQQSLKADNFKALGFLTTPLLFLMIGVWLVNSHNTYLFVLGLLSLSICSTQFFILLHECGHLHFFSKKWMNIVFGNVFGFLAGIPFYTWKSMHHLHHRWTGWRDKDPTTEVTVDPSGNSAINVIANISWWLFFPIFYLVYHVSNYWNIMKIRRFLLPKSARKSLFSIVFYSLGYLVLFVFFCDCMLRVVLPVFALSCIWRELIILTQHTHIDIPLANGESVSPVSYLKQIEFTRSFYVAPFIAKYFLFNFNLHEVHHAYPGIPAYYLNKVDLKLPRKPKYWEWFKQAKSMTGVDFVFRTSKHTNKYF